MSLRKVVEWRIYRNRKRLSEIDVELADLRLKRQVSSLLYGELEAILNELTATEMHPSPDTGIPVSDINP